MSEQRDPFKFLFNIDFRKYVTILAQQKSFVLVFCLSACLSSLALTYVFSEKYETGVAIFYRPIETSLLRQKDTETFGAPAPTPPFKVIIQTLQDILRSEVILKPVVNELGLDKEEVAIYNSLWYKRWYQKTKDFAKEQLSNLKSLLKYGRIIEEDAAVSAIQRLRKSLRIKATKDSYIYFLVIKDKYPERAATIVDTAGKILVDWLKDQDKNPAEDKYHQLREQLNEKEKEIEKLRADLEELLVQNKVVSVQEETAKGVNSLYELELELIRLKAQIEEKRKEVLELRLAAENKSKSYVHPEDIKKMESEILFKKIEFESLLKKSEFIISSITDLKTRLDELPSLDRKIKNLNMRIEAYTREYNHLNDFYVEALGQATTIQSEIRVLHKAVVPKKPVQPIKAYHVGLTAFLSLFMSIGLVYVFAFFNIRIFFKSMGVKGRRTHSPETVQK